MIAYDWPALPGLNDKPVWTGQGFQVAQTIISVLSYEIGRSGWTDDLTRFHEETAGPDHFIDLASRCQALEQLNKYVKKPSPIVLEVGCSSGFMLRQLREGLPQALVIGADYVREPLEQLARRYLDLPLLHFDLTWCPLPANSIDAVVLLNVLEHIQDDGEALRQVARILKPGGIAVIEVPAGPDLYDVYDKLLLHYRRYSLKGLRRVVKSAGLEILRQSHLGFFFYPGFWAVKKRNRRFLSEGETVHKRVVEENISKTGSSVMLATLMRAELFFGRYISYPFGTRCLMTCAKLGGG